VLDVEPEPLVDDVAIVAPPPLPAEVVVPVVALVSVELAVPAIPAESPEDVVVPDVPPVELPEDPVAPVAPVVAVYAKGTPLLAPAGESAVTMTVVPGAFAGAVALQLVPPVQPIKPPATPPKLTPVTAPRFVPTSETCVPVPPVEGLIERIDGSAGCAVGVGVEAGATVGVTVIRQARQAIALATGREQAKQCGVGVGVGKQPRHAIAVDTGLRQVMQGEAETGASKVLGASSAWVPRAPKGAPAPFVGSRLAPTIMRIATGNASQACRNSPSPLGSFTPAPLHSSVV
jgi:hypothetical protein